jgi:hypothetical protein
MSNTISNLCKLRATLPILSQLIASTLLLGGLSGIIATVNAQSAKQTDIQPTNIEKEAQAQRSMGVLNRAQQAFYLENGKFAPDIELLGTGIEPKGEYYFYGIYRSDLTQGVSMVAKAYDPSLKGYLGGVFSAKVDGEVITIAGICETIKPGLLPGEPKAPKSSLESIECPAGYQLLKP